MARPTADGASLRRVAVDAESRFADPVFDDPTGSFRKNYGLQRDALLLIRPDGYAGRIATDDMCATMQAAGQAMTPALSENI